MNPLKKAYCRIFQNVFKFALPLLPYRNPKIIGSVKGIPEVLEKRNYNNVLIITDAGIRSLGLTERLEQTLKRSCIGDSPALLLAELPLGSRYFPPNCLSYSSLLYSKISELINSMSSFDGQ